MSIQVPVDVRTVIESEQLQRATVGPTAVRTAVILALYGGGTALGLWVGHPLVWVAVWLVQAVILNGALSASHEGVHGNLARHPGVNRAFAELWSLPLLLNFSLYRAYHLEHHRHTRMEGDPEPQAEFRSPWGYLLAAPFLGLVTLVQMWGTSLLTLAGRFPRYVRTARQRRAVRRDAVLVLLATAVAVGAAIVSPSLVLAAWGAPLLLSSPVFTLTALPEHYGCPRVPDPLAATRSTVSNRVFSYLYWENNLHAEHHLLPGVPYHRQHRVRAVLGDRVVNSSPSYLRWHLGLLRALARPTVIDLRDEVDLRDASEPRTTGAPRRPGAPVDAGAVDRE